jgi:hypothetical protein
VSKEKKTTMGQKLSLSKEEENELLNLFQLGQPQNLQESPKIQPIVMMRMMAPTALGSRQRVMQPIAPARQQRGIVLANNVQRLPVRQAQLVGQHREKKMKT